jgi:hypothetical protein
VVLAVGFHTTVGELIHYVEASAEVDGEGRQDSPFILNQIP